MTNWNTAWVFCNFSSPLKELPHHKSDIKFNLSMNINNPINNTYIGKYWQRPTISKRQLKYMESFLYGITAPWWLSFKALTISQHLLMHMHAASVHSTIWITSSLQEVEASLKKSEGVEGWEPQEKKYLQLENTRTNFFSWPRILDILKRSRQHLWEHI